MNKRKLLVTSTLLTKLALNCYSFLNSLQTHEQSRSSIFRTTDPSNEFLNEPARHAVDETLRLTNVLAPQTSVGTKDFNNTQHNQSHLRSLHSHPPLESIDVNDSSSYDHIEQRHSSHDNLTAYIPNKASATTQSTENNMTDIDDRSHLTRQRSASTTVTSPVNAMGTSLTVLENSPTRSESFYGSSSVVSFLNQFHKPSGRTDRLLNTTLTSVMHPDKSTRNVPQPSSRTGNGQSSSVAMLYGEYSLPPRVVADMLLKAYFDNFHIFYPWVHTDSFHKSYAELWTGEPDSRDDLSSLPDIGLGGRNCPTSTFYCALNAIFALGCEHANLSPQDKVAISTVVQERLDKLLPLELLDGSELCHVQALMLAAQYFQCTNSPSRCWNIIGLAYRMAIGLGLHLQCTSDRGLRIELEMRRRVWHGCTQFDV